MCSLWRSGHSSFIIDKVERVEGNGVCGQYLVVDYTIELHLDNKLRGEERERGRRGKRGRKRDGRREKGEREGREREGERERERE